MAWKPAVDIEIKKDILSHRDAVFSFLWLVLIGSFVFGSFVSNHTVRLALTLAKNRGPQRTHKPVYLSRTQYRISETRIRLFENQDPSFADGRADMRTPLPEPKISTRIETRIGNQDPSYASSLMGMMKEHTTGQGKKIKSIYSFSFSSYFSQFLTPSSACYLSPCKRCSLIKRQRHFGLNFSP